MDSFEKYASSEHLKSTLVERLEKVAVFARVKRKKGKGQKVSSKPPKGVRADVVKARARKEARKAARKAAEEHKEIMDRRERYKRFGSYAGIPGEGTQSQAPKPRAGQRLARLKMGGKVLGGLAITGAAAAGLTKLLKSRQAAKKALPEMSKAQKLIEMIKRNSKKSMAAGAVGASGLGAGLAALVANKKR